MKGPRGKGVEKLNMNLLGGGGGFEEEAHGYFSLSDL